MQKSSLRFFIFIIIIGIIGQLSAEIIAPSLPYIAYDFGVKDGLAQYTISYYMLGMAIPAMIFGIYADRIGRRKVLIVSSCLGLIGSLLCVIAPNIYILIFARIIQGIAFGGISSMSMTLLRDRFNGIALARYMSYFGIAFSLSIDLAPFIGGFIQAVVSWRIILLIILLQNLCVLYMSYKYQEIYIYPEKTAILDGLIDKMKVIFKDKNFAVYTILNGIIYAIFMSYIVVATFIIQTILHQSSIYYGVLTLCLSVVFAFFCFINGRLVGKVNPNKLITLGFALSVISGLFLMLNIYIGLGIVLFIISIIPMFIGSAFVFPNVNSLAYTTISKDIGLASAMSNTIKLFMAFWVTWLIGLFSSGTTVLGVSITLMAGLALIITISLVDN
ncbi:MAG: MFS transporter [Burkholderiales bacterium]|nr:MFS transporter [Burkholderiales bacterium]